MLLPTPSLFGGILLGLLSPWVSVGFKNTHHAPFAFPFLNFNKPHLYPGILLGFFHMGMHHQGLLKTLFAINTTTTLLRVLCVDHLERTQLQID
jgi:sorbitol-specific phosphotransferase system component IIC